MNRCTKLISVLVCVLLTFSLAACSDPGAPVHDVSNPQYVEGITDVISSELEAFLTENKDRTTFGSGEKIAADYLSARLTEYGYVDTVTHDFTVDEGSVKGLTSQNVSAKLVGSGESENKPNVVLGAYYDNRYSAAYKNAATYKAEAALTGGTGVAALLSVAKYLAENHGTAESAFDFDVTIAFFGASYLYTDGAREFLRNGMTADQRKNTVLMIEMQRLGVDHVYSYADARETKREGFFDAVAKDNGLNVYKPTQKTPLITGVTATEGIPYYQWAHGGLFSEFADAGIPTLNLIGANWETVDLSDAESANHPNISYTENDTLENLKKYYPDYAEKIATAVTLVIRSLEAPQFAETMRYDRENYPQTDILTMQWVWYLIAAGAMLIAIAIVFIINGRLAKKYKPQEIKPRRMKMAVFGMDYEDKNAADIFIDIRKTDAASEDIFPGIPNNDAAPITGVEDIFPPPLGNIGKTQADSRASENTAGPQSDAEANAQMTDERPSEPFELEAARSVEPSESEAEQVEDDVSITKEPPQSDKIESQTTAESVAPKKRATVSAKKSVGAKRSKAAGDKKSDEQNKDGNNDDK